MKNNQNSDDKDDFIDEKREIGLNPAYILKIFDEFSTLIVEYPNLPDGKLIRCIIYSLSLFGMRPEKIQKLITFSVDKIGVGHSDEEFKKRLTELYKNIMVVSDDKGNQNVYYHDDKKVNKNG